MCATSERSLEKKKSIGNVVSVTDSKSFKKKKLDEEINLCQDISVVYKTIKVSGVFFLSVLVIDLPRLPVIFVINRAEIPR